MAKRDQRILQTEKTRHNILERETRASACDALSRDTSRPSQSTSFEHPRSAAIVRRSSPTGRSSRRRAKRNCSDALCVKNANAPKAKTRIPHTGSELGPEHPSPGMRLDLWPNSPGCILSECDWVAHHRCGGKRWAIS